MRYNVESFPSSLFLGCLLAWQDPDEGISSGIYRLAAVSMDAPDLDIDDEVVLLNGSSEVEAPLHECLAVITPEKALDLLRGINVESGEAECRKVLTEIYGFTADDLKGMTVQAMAAKIVEIDADPTDLASLSAELQAEGFRVIVVDAIYTIKPSEDSRTVYVTRPEYEMLLTQNLIWCDGINWLYQNCPAFWDCLGENLENIFTR